MPIDRWWRLANYRLSHASARESATISRLGFRWTVDPRTYIGRCLYLEGEFEPTTTGVFRKLVKPGHCILDVGANLGYFSLLATRQVGTTGRVVAFEPTEFYRTQLIGNLHLNKLNEHVEVLPYGLSDVDTTADIQIGDSSATMHSTNNDRHCLSETIELRRLDGLADQLRLTRLDLVKVDIDGHEPSFLRGAQQTLQRFRPILIIEFAQHCLHVAGSGARELRGQLEELGYELCNERTLKPFTDDMNFLMHCANYSHSANVVAVHRDNRLPGSFT